MGNLSRDAAESQRNKYRRSNLEKIIAGDLPASDGHRFDGTDLEILTELVNDETVTMQAIATTMCDAGFQVSHSAVSSFLRGVIRGAGPLWGARKKASE